MRSVIYRLFIIMMISTPMTSTAQVDEDELGAWYMYFWNTTFNESPWGLQGDVQYRNWNIMGDLEQLLLRGGITYKPSGADVNFTLGYAHITTGEYGDGDATTTESRIYQEALLPQKVGARVFLTHRFRYEQRFVEDQDMRTRYRYNLFINVPFNQTSLSKGAVYLAFYNELFINGQRDIGDGITVEYFDRNRTYGAIGYSISDNMRVQGGIMHQLTNSIGKDQLQFSFHHKF